MTIHVTSQGAAETRRFGKAPWWALLLEGAALTALGLGAALLPFLASLAVTTLVGWIYMFAGGVRVVSGLTHRGPGYLWSVLMGCIALGAGVGVLAWPLLGVISLTLVLSAYLLTDAVMSFALAATAGRHAGRGVWLGVTGVANLVLAGLVLLGLTRGAVWILGLVVAVNLVFIGIALAAVGLASRRHAAE